MTWWQVRRLVIGDEGSAGRSYGRAHGRTGDGWTGEGNARTVDGRVQRGRSFLFVCGTVQGSRRTSEAAVQDASKTGHQLLQRRCRRAVAQVAHEQLHATCELVWEGSAGRSYGRDGWTGKRWKYCVADQMRARIKEDLQRCNHPPAIGVGEMLWFRFVDRNCNTGFSFTNRSEPVKQPANATILDVGGYGGESIVWVVRHSVSLPSSLFIRISCRRVPYRQQLAVPCLIATMADSNSSRQGSCRPAVV